MMRLFISHASGNVNVAREVEAALSSAGFDPWLDDSDIRVGVLLRKELQDAIAASDAVVLLWSAPASRSRWVASEILTAFHLDRFIVPCVVSGAELPQFLSRSIFCDLRRKRAQALDRLCRQLESIPKARNEFPAGAPYREPELQNEIERLIAKQSQITSAPIEQALQLQAALDPEMQAAEQRWPYDSFILSLAGYHRKNAYMFQHWAEYAAGRYPKDPVLQQAEQRFISALFVNPLDPGALNGAGNVLLFEGDLDAGLFFVERAIQCAADQGFRYEEAEHDRRVILRRMGRAASG